MRIVMSVPVPGPPRARIEDLAIPADLFEAGTIDSPHVAVPGRKEAAIGQQSEAAPGHGYFRRPAAIDIARLVQRAIHLYGVPETRAIPIEKSPSLAAR